MKNLKLLYGMVGLIGTLNFSSVAVAGEVHCTAKGEDSLTVTIESNRKNEREGFFPLSHVINVYRDNALLLSEPARSAPGINGTFYYGTTVELDMRYYRSALYSRNRIFSSVELECKILAD